MHYLDKLLANLACQFICGKKRLQYFTILKSFSYWRFWNITVYFSLFASSLSESIPSPKKQFTRTNDKNIILKNYYSRTTPKLPLSSHSLQLTL